VSPLIRFLYNSIFYNTCNIHSKFKELIKAHTSGAQSGVSQDRASLMK
jgi:hypothetical protein